MFQERTRRDICLGIKEDWGFNRWVTEMTAGRSGQLRGLVWWQGEKNCTWYSGHKKCWEIDKTQRGQRVQTEEGKENKTGVTGKKTWPTGKPFQIGTDCKAKDKQRQEEEKENMTLAKISTTLVSKIFPAEERGKLKQTRQQVEVTCQVQASQASLFSTVTHATLGTCQVDHL